MREQARRAGIPPATLTRLAQRFGLRGYDAVRMLYADAVRQRPESYRGRAEELLVRRDSEGDLALVQDIFASLTQHLQELSLPEAVERFTAAADLIARADRVFCLGQRSSFSVAYIFHYVRSLFGSNSVLVDGSGGSGVDALRTIGSGDVLLAISVKPYVRHTIEAAKFAKDRGARVVAVTDSEISPLVAQSPTRQCWCAPTRRRSFTPWRRPLPRSNAWRRWSPRAAARRRWPRSTKANGN